MKGINSAFQDDIVTSHKSIKVNVQSFENTISSKMSVANDGEIENLATVEKLQNEVQITVQEEDDR